MNPVQTSLSVKVWTDRDTSGAQTPNYSVGDKIRIYTSVNQDAYVYLFNVDPNGQVDLILPNRYAGGANYVRAGTVKAFPSSQDRFTFDIAAPYGLNKVLALASKTQLNLNDIATFQTQNSTQGFADVKVQGQQQLAQALSIVVNPVPQNTWISDTAYYNVAQGYGSAQPAPAPVVSVPSYGFPVYTPRVTSGAAPSAPTATRTTCTRTTPRSCSARASVRWTAAPTVAGTRASSRTATAPANCASP